MVQFIPRPKGFGEQIAEGIGQGSSQGLQQMQQMMMQAALERQKQNRLQQLLTPSAQQAAGSQLQGEPPQTQDFSGISSQQRLALAAEFPEIARELGRQEDISLKREKIQSGKESEKHARHYEIAKKSLENAGEMARILPQKEAALEAMKESIKTGDLSYFSPDNLAEVTGIDAFRSPEGAAFKTASKEFFLGNTMRVGAKGLNQWFEKQVLEMGPKIGRSKEANLAVTEMLNMEMDIQKKEIELTNKIADEMESKFGYIKRDLPERVYKEISEYAKNRQKETKSRIEDIKDLYSPINKEGHLMRDPAGNLRRVSPKDYKAAKSAGYTVAK